MFQNIKYEVIRNKIFSIGNHHGKDSRIGLILPQQYKFPVSGFSQDWGITQTDKLQEKMWMGKMPHIIQ